MSDCLLIERLNKNLGGIKVLTQFSCFVRSAEILGIIGPNGAGKTTLFNIINGLIPADTGTVKFKGSDITGLVPHRIANLGIARMFQNLRLIWGLSAIENVLLSFKNSSGEQLRNVFFKYQSSRNLEMNNRKTALSLLEDVGLDHKAYEPAKDLSYGQQKLLSLTCCLAAQADLLLLDEPISGQQ